MLKSEGSKVCEVGDACWDDARDIEADKDNSFDDVSLMLS